MIRSANIIILISIAFVFAAYIAPSFYGNTDESKIDQTRLSQSVISNHLNEFKKHHGTYPTSAKGLSAIAPIVAEKRNNVERFKFDPWDREFLYESDGEKFRLVSAGIDGQFATSDDMELTP